MDFHVLRDGKQIGPLAEEVVKVGLETSEFSPSDLFWTAGMAGWEPLNTRFAESKRHTEEVIAPPPSNPPPSNPPPSNPPPSNPPPSNPPPSNPPGEPLAQLRPQIPAPRKPEGMTTEEQTDQSHIQAASDLITSKLGLEKIEGFSLGNFFSEVFRKRPASELENLLTVGSEITTPNLHPSMGTMPNPWLFFRVLVGALTAFFVFLASWNEFENLNVVPGLISVGSFAVPLSILILFYELNTPRNISIARVIQLLVLGGALSIFLSLIIFEITPLLGVLGASAAAIVEEIGKLATVLFAMRFIPMNRYKFRLNALLFGAAVGAGFAAFESAGYALRIGLENTDAMISNITLRGVMSPFGHIVWTAIATSAYWIARKDTTDLGTTLRSGKFLTLFSVPVALHFAWNLPFEGPLLLKYWILGLVAWIVVFSLVQTGLREIHGFAQIDPKMVDASPVLENAKVEPQGL